MCATCGCSTEDHANHAHEENGHHARAGTRMVQLGRDLLAKNSAVAEENRAWLASRRIAALNLVSSPGAGKTTLLERTVREMKELSISVIEGDQETERDAARIRAAGAHAFQINTGTGCHLDAHGVGHALSTLGPADGSLLFIENVGNLVCPALFDLGERAKVVILSVTEGDDKPLKYPHMFRASRAMVVNKVDLLPYVSFDVARCIAYARALSRDIEIFQVSATTGAGMDAWRLWLRQQVSAQ